MDFEKDFEHAVYRPHEPVGYDPLIIIEKMIDAKILGLEGRISDMMEMKFSRLEQAMRESGCI